MTPFGTHSDTVLVRFGCHFERTLNAHSAETPVCSKISVLETRILSLLGGQMRILLLGASHPKRILNSIFHFSMKKARILC